MKTGKLMLIQASLKAPKNQKNAFGGYNYRSCEDILEAVKPLLYDTQTTLTISDDIVEVGGRVYVKATATLKDCETGEIIEQNTAYARESEAKKGMDDSQITGATSSYARKYALNGLFCIDDVKDADATNDHGKSEKTKKTEKSETKSNPNGRFQKAVNAHDFMRQCLSEDDYINKIKDKYEVDEIVEGQLRKAYQDVTAIVDTADLPFGD